jgi:hypothetical protein
MSKPHVSLRRSQAPELSAYCQRLLLAALTGFLTASVTQMQIYTVQDSDLCLAGTAEIPVGGLFMDKIIPEAELPIKCVAFSHCFRTEAGAAGRENRYRHEALLILVAHWRTSTCNSRFLKPTSERTKMGSQGSTQMECTNWELAVFTP